MKKVLVTLLMGLLTVGLLGGTALATESAFTITDDVREQIKDGDIDKAEKTLRKIIVTKKLINENLRHISRFLSVEIEVLN